MSSEAPAMHAPDDDERTLHKLGYAQVLYREMGGFSNFAISFTIISILAGCLTSYAIAFNQGGPVAITWGWLIVGLFCTIVALAMGEIASTYPTEYLGDTIESLARAGRAGYRVVEVPVGMRAREEGISTASSISSSWYLLRVVAAVWLQRYRPRGRRVVSLTRWESEPS